MQKVDIYIGTTLRGPAKGEGSVMYIMKSILPSGKEYESKPQMSKEADTTESRLVLRAIWDAIQRLNFSCEVTIWTECQYVANAINNMWPKAWEKNDWKNSRGEEVKDSEKWAQISANIDKNGHLVSVNREKHEYAEWMRYKLGILASHEGYFSEAK